MILPDTDRAELERALAGVETAAVAAGHVHLQWLRRVNGKLWFCVGSVGLVYEHTEPIDPVPFMPWSEYAIVSDELEVSFRRVAVRRRGADRRGEGGGLPPRRDLGGDVAALKVGFCDEFDGGFGWIVDEFMERCSHALVEDGRVWVIDPVDGDGVEERIRAAGTPAGVLQLLDRHNRDCAALAARLGVRHHVVPQGSLGPFAPSPSRTTDSWKEVALWWPDRRVLVCADVLGTAPYFRAGDERLGVHPLLRLRPPRRQLGSASAEGHPLRSRRWSPR